MDTQYSALLLHIAHRSLEVATREPAKFDSHAVLQQIMGAATIPASLMVKRACFVTLQKKGQLRGCTGTLVERLPLAEEIVYSTHNTALHDPRFQPVTAKEVPSIHIEISILSPSQRLTYANPNELLQKLEPHVHGVTLRLHHNRATFLPQVWERFPDPVEFLGALCQKMGLAPDTWRETPMEVETYLTTTVMDSL